MSPHYFRTSKIVLLKASKHCKHSPSLTRTMSQRKANAGQMTSTEWFINKRLTNRNAFQSYSEVLKLAEIGAVIPVSNAWPERGASSMKHIRQRSSLKTDLLNALMQVAVNGPPVLESLPVVETAVNNSLGRKKQKKNKQCNCFKQPGNSIWGTEPVNIPYIFPWSVGLFICSTRLFLWSTRLFYGQTQLFIWSTKHFLYSQLDFFYGQLDIF